MGYFYALGLRESMDLETALSVHFAGNCYPPIPQKMVPVAMATIEAIRAGERDRRITLPEGVKFRDGRRSVDAGQLSESLRIGAFI